MAFSEGQKTALLTLAAAVIGALLGAAGTYTSARLTADAQAEVVDKQLAEYGNQNAAAFLRENRMSAYSEAAAAYSTLNSSLGPAFTRLTAVDTEAEAAEARELAGSLRSEIDAARIVTARLLLLAPAPVRKATETLNLAHTRALQQFVANLDGYSAAAPGALVPSQRMRDAFNDRRAAYRAWLEVVQRDVQAEGPDAAPS